MMIFSEFQQILKLVYSFVPKTKMQGPICGVIVDKDKNMLFASTYEAGILHFLEDSVTEESLVLPERIVSKLLRLPSNTKWEGIKKKGSAYTIKVGEIVLTFSAKEGETVDYRIPKPEKGEESQIVPAFLEGLRWIFPFACEDDRKVNLHGVFVGEEHLYACDNIRLTTLKVPTPEKLHNIFIPYNCLSFIKDRNEIFSVSCSESVLFFFSESYLIYFTRIEGEFPSVDNFLEQVHAEPGFKVEVPCTDDLKLFCDLLSGDLDSIPLEVRITKNVLEFRTCQLTGTTHSLELGISCTAEKEGTIYVNARFFVEGLMLYRKFYVGGGWIYFKDEKSEYIVMRIRGPEE